MRCAVRDAFEGLAVGHSRDGSDDLAVSLKTPGVGERADLVSKAVQQGWTVAVNKVIGAVAVRRAAE
jgi:hypothetical protein